MNKSSKIYVAGHNGLVGGAIIRCLRNSGYTDIITKTHAELDLTNQAAVNAFFSSERPEYVILSAAKVGGIGANLNFPTEFIYDNMMIGFNVVHAAFLHGVKKLINLGSSCIYPKLAAQPIKEEYLMTGALEPTNDAYALAKISVIKLCNSYNKQYGTNYLSVMPTNLFGPGDTYNLDKSHVLPAMILKFHNAKMSGLDKVVLWGDGTPYREFLYSDDLADAILFLLVNKDAHEIGELINIGTGFDISINTLAEMINDVVYADTMGRKCRIEWDTTKPNGTHRKLLDVSKIQSYGWKAKMDFSQGIKKSYIDFLENKRGTV